MMCAIVLLVNYQTTRNLNFKLDEFEDTKGVIRIRNSKKDRQHNGQKD
jgi:hypothetical protein